MAAEEKTKEYLLLEKKLERYMVNNVLVSPYLYIKDFGADAPNVAKDVRAYLESSDNNIRAAVPFHISELLTMLKISPAIEANIRKYSKQFDGENIPPELINCINGFISNSFRVGADQEYPASTYTQTDIDDMNYSCNVCIETIAKIDDYKKILDKYPKLDKKFEVRLDELVSENAVRTAFSIAQYNQPEVWKNIVVDISKLCGNELAKMVPLNDPYVKYRNAIMNDEGLKQLQQHYLAELTKVIEGSNIDGNVKLAHCQVLEEKFAKDVVRHLESVPGDTSCNPRIESLKEQFVKEVKATGAYDEAFKNADAAMSKKASEISTKPQAMNMGNEVQDNSARKPGDVPSLNATVKQVG